MLPTTVIGYWLRAPKDKLTILKTATDGLFTTHNGLFYSRDRGMVWKEDCKVSHSSTCWLRTKEDDPSLFNSMRCLIWLLSKKCIDCFIYSSSHGFNKSIIEKWEQSISRKGIECTFERPEIDLKKLVYAAIRQENLHAVHLIKTQNDLTTMTGYSVFRCKQLAPSLRLEGQLSEQLEFHEICDCHVKLGEWECIIHPNWLEIENDQLGDDDVDILHKASEFSHLFLEKLSTAGIIP